MAHSHHGHDHHHHHHHGPADTGDWRYGVGVGLNLAMVAVEAVAGVLAHSTALLADASHNLSDVLGLVMAGVAAWLARRPARGRRTYGYSKATVLAALANALVLVFASGAIAWEAVRRLFQPQAVEPRLVMAVAAVGVVVNTATALMFLRGRKDDINVRGAFLHMAADAAVSAGVIVAGLAILLTGRTWIDPAVSLGIVVVIGLGTWGLLRESMALAMDAAPQGIDVEGVHALLEGADGVTEVHDLHVWGLSTTETALTAHLVRPQDGDDAALRRTLSHALAHRFGIGHATLQIERCRDDSCPDHA